jgi:uncharacterized protein with PQ loop repeat
MSKYDVIGYIGGSIVASSAPLQLYKCFTTQSTKDISWMWIANYLTGILCIFIYAQLENIPPVWVPLCLEISSTCLLLCLKSYLELLEHKVYVNEVSTQTDPNDLVDTSLTSPEIENFEIEITKSSQQSNYALVVTSDGSI